MDNKIDYEVLAKMIGVNTYTLNRLFSVLTNISLAEYIRKRRLSNAGFDICNSRLKIIDVAVKYQYENATSFSRAFYKFHGIKPSLVNKETRLKNFPRIVFNEDINITTELDYEVIELGELNLYGLSIPTSNNGIGNDAPLFFKEFEDKYKSYYGDVPYGLVTYDIVRAECQRYYCMYDKKINDFEHITIPPSKWLKFKINSQNPSEIQNNSHVFYNEFLPSCKFNLRELPEIEYYHDGITDFLVAIY